MLVLELTTGLFPDRETLTEALAALPGAERRRLDLSTRETPADWDAVVALIRQADRVVTV